ncbi:MAG: hypothetical protein HQ492_11870 [Woeseiaceae bacterium]|nr:hypothetical protein [Woeseiaceae bacterium]
MRNMTGYLFVPMLLLNLMACGKSEVSEGRKVEASGKEASDPGAVPAEVLIVAHAALPELSVREAEYETRDGNEYYDVGGTLPDGSEWELDMTRIDGTWTVVEKQRDIAMELVPGGVSNVLETKLPEWHPDRVIESDQGDGVIIYEFFGKTEEGEATKIEIMWQQGRAELLVNEWLH